MLAEIIIIDISKMTEQEALNTEEKRKERKNLKQLAKTGNNKIYSNQTDTKSGKL